MDVMTFENLYSANVKPMLAYVKRAFPGLDADEIVGDSFAKIWRNNENIVDSNLNGYVQRTVKRMAIDAIRAIGTHPVTESIFADATDGEDTSGMRVELASSSDHNPAIGTLAHVTAILTPEQRRVVMMRLDYSHAEIAVILAGENGVTLTDDELVKETDRVKKLYNRARATMRRSFPERVVVAA